MATEKINGISPIEIGINRDKKYYFRYVLKRRKIFIGNIINSSTKVFLTTFRIFTTLFLYKFFVAVLFQNSIFVMKLIKLFYN